MFKRVLFILILSPLVLNLALISQENSSIKQINYNLSIINNLIDSTRKTSNDSCKLILCQQVVKTFQSILIKSYTFSMPFDSLKRIGKVQSPDLKFRLFTWNVQLSDATNKFFAIIQLNPSKDSACKLIVLEDKSQIFSGNLSTAMFNPNNWYGALYYEIIPTKIKDKTIYSLLGMHFNGLFTNKKIIESMYFDENQNPVFGFPIFEYNQHLQNRILFEYSINATMSLRYDKRLKMIIFDHLSPPSPLYNGDYKFYGPDFSFDGLKFDGNKWVYQANIDFHK